MSAIIINATCVGRKLYGIGMYTMCLLKEFANTSRDIKLIVYANRAAKTHFTHILPPKNMFIRWVTKYSSPDYGFFGNVLRVIFAQVLSFRFNYSLVFNPDQLGLMLGRRNQVITIHDLIPLMDKKNHPQQYFLYRFVLGFTLRRARTIITPSQHTCKQLIKKYRLQIGKVHTIYHGVHFLDMELPSKEIRKKGKFILYVGRVSPTKNVQGLIQAFQAISGQIEQSLVIVGGNEIRKTHMATVNVTDRIIFKGYLNRTRIHNLMRTADLFVFPSFYEGFGFPPLEAMACGCPVVVSKSSSLPEICGEAAYYVDPSSVDSIANGITTVLSDPQLQLELVNKGFQQVRKYTWKKSASRHLQIFQKVQSL